MSLSRRQALDRAAPNSPFNLNATYPPPWPLDLGITIDFLPNATGVHKIGDTWRRRYSNFSRPH